MKKILFVSACFTSALLFCQQGCTSSSQTEKLLHKEIIRNNKIKLDSLSYGMRLRDVYDFINEDLSPEAEDLNPELGAKIMGKGEKEYLVQFYEYSDSGKDGNLYFRDDRYFPLIFKDKILFGINWDDYENLIGESFLRSDESKPIKGKSNPFKTEDDDTLMIGIGTGFLINNKGYIVTNSHVVEDVKNISVYSPALNKKFATIGVLKDIPNDLVILKIIDSTYSTDTFSKINYRITVQDEIKIGQQVFTLGFPLTNVLGTTARLTDGVINSKYGMENDPKLYQISNPLQHGNSGGPLFNMKGNLVGVAVSVLSTLQLSNSGIMSTNINFAVKADYLKAMLNTGYIDEPVNENEPVQDLKLEQLAEQLSEFIVMIIAEDDFRAEHKKKASGIK